MQFLIDEDMPRSTSALLRRYGHKSVDVRDVDLRGAKDFQVASYAQGKSLCLIIGDFDFSNIRNYPPAQYAGLIVLSIPKDATVLFILNLIEDLLQREKLISNISGKLAIVEPGRVRTRRE